MFLALATTIPAQHTQPKKMNTTSSLSAGTIQTTTLVDLQRQRQQQNEGVLLLEYARGHSSPSREEVKTSNESIVQVDVNELCLLLPPSNLQEETIRLRIITGISKSPGIRISLITEEGEKLIYLTEARSGRNALNKFTEQQWQRVIEFIHQENERKCPDAILDDAALIRRLDSLSKDRDSSSRLKQLKSLRDAGVDVAAWALRVIAALGSKENDKSRPTL